MLLYVIVPYCTMHLSLLVFNIATHLRSVYDRSSTNTDSLAGSDGLTVLPVMLKPGYALALVIAPRDSKVLRRV